ncbi:MAG: hypothetical protein R2789_14170 [Microthrixaceae bacterium]
MREGAEAPPPPPVAFDSDAAADADSRDGGRPREACGVFAVSRPASRSRTSRISGSMRSNTGDRSLRASPPPMATT